MTNRPIFSFELPEDIKKKLQKEAAEKEMTLAGLIRYILKQYLKNM